MSIPALWQFRVIFLMIVLGEARQELVMAAAVPIIASLASVMVRKGGGWAVMAWLAGTSLAWMEQILVSKFCLI